VEMMTGFLSITIDPFERLKETPDIAVVMFNISMNRILKNGLPKYEDYFTYLVSFTQYII
jgi:hypothetical protein